MPAERFQRQGQYGRLRRKQPFPDLGLTLNTWASNPERCRFRCLVLGCLRFGTYVGGPLAYSPLRCRINSGGAFARKAGAHAVESRCG
jgi:hypothetical protein